MSKNKRFGEKHGFCKGGEISPFYNTYMTMRARCENPKHNRWDIYGGRGIKCLWDSFEKFRNDMYKSYASHRKTHPGVRQTQIDRINVDGDYCKENCRWVTAAEQNRNTRNTTFIQFRGTRKSLHDWAETIGIQSGTLHYRIKSGWPVERVLSNRLMKNQFC